jgi:hypothetical protein
LGNFPGEGRGILYIRFLENYMLANEIKTSLSEPATLERLYRQNPVAFKSTFLAIYPEIEEEPTAQIWHARLIYASEDLAWGQSKDWAFLGIWVIVAAFFMQFPDIFGISHDAYFPRNVSFIVLAGMGGLFIFQQQLRLSGIWPALAALLFSMVYLNAIPMDSKSDVFALACLHVPIFLWIFVGYLYVGGLNPAGPKGIEFLRFHGDLLVMTALIVLAGGLFTALTINLFHLINLDIEKYYFQYGVVSLLPAVPVLAAFLVQKNPHLVSKISPLIARIFTPLVFLTLLLFLGATFFTEKDLFNDREYLLVFNGVLVGVMALLLFSLSEVTKKSFNKFYQYVVVGLAALALIDNGLALSAIIFRLAEFGISPNRLAVLGSNLLMMAHVAWVTKNLIAFVQGKQEINSVENSMTGFLPYYGAWAALVAFVFPLVF